MSGEANGASPTTPSTATGSLGLACRRILRIDDAAAGGALPVQHPVDHRGGASDAGLNGNGADRAIAAARPAFHAGIAIQDADTSFSDLQHPMGADLQARAAAGALIRIDHQRDHIPQIDQILHFIPL